MAQDKTRLRKTYSFFRQQPIPVVYGTGGGGGGGGTGGDQFWYSTTNDSIYTTGSVLVRGALTTLDSSYDIGTDIFFFVSGSIGNVTNKRVSVFGGDLTVSGSIITKTDITVSGDLYATSDLFVSGTALIANGLSGSLTKLPDGTSYLIAGSNISITTGSNGSVTVSSSATAAAAGSNSEIQFNNGGSFGASPNFSFNSTSNTLSLTGSLGMKGDIIPDTDTTYTLGTTSKRWAHVYTGDLHLRNDRGDWTIVEERDYLCVVNNITGKKYKMMLQPIDE